jgi:tetratricopeptide (TPR) repeat protein
MLAAQNKNIDMALTAFAGAADNLDGQQLGAALYNQGTLLLETGQADAAIPLLERAMVLMPGDRMSRENLLLALSQSSPFAMDGDGSSKPTETDEGDEMSAEQAEQLVNSVRLDPSAPPIEATIHPPTVLKEW